MTGIHMQVEVVDGLDSILSAGKTDG